MVEIHKPGKPWQEVSEAVSNMFVGQGYKLEEGTKLDGIYGIGSAAGRFWGGGFVKRYKFSIKIFTTPDNGTLIHYEKAMSGFSGGAIGVSKMNKEFDRVYSLLYYL